MTDRIRIQNDTGIGNGTKIIDTETGKTIPGVVSIDVHVGVDDVNVAVVRLHLVQVDFMALPRFEFKDPKTGEWRGVRAVEWSDGERVEL